MYYFYGRVTKEGIMLWNEEMDPISFETMSEVNKWVVETSKTVNEPVKVVW